MKNLMTRTLVGLVITVIIGFGVVSYQDMEKNVSGENSLPQNIDITYKEK